MKSKIKELPVKIDAAKQHNNNGFIKICDVVYQYNNKLFMYVRSDIVVRYRRLQKKGYSISAIQTKLKLT